MEKPSGKDKTSKFRDIATIPNAMTLYRLLKAPWAYRTAAAEPGKDFGWLKLGLVSTTDLEGNVARLENLPRIGKFLGYLGCRQSNIGRNGDPIADTAYGAAVVAGGLRSGAIPRNIAISSLFQKTTKSILTVHSKLVKDKEYKVTNTGKAGEAISTLGFYGCIAAEAIDSPTVQKAAKGASCIMAATGIGLSTLAQIEYANEGEYIDTPRLLNMAQTVDQKLDRFTPS